MSMCHTNRNSSDLAIEALRQLLADRVAILKSKEWTENVLLNFLWTLTSMESESQMKALGIFKHTMDKLNEFGEKLSEETTHACLIVRSAPCIVFFNTNRIQLIWRLVDKALSSGDSYTAGQWCRCVLEQQVLQISPRNKSTVLR